MCAMDDAWMKSVRWPIPTQPGEQTMAYLIKRLLAGEDGATMVEYALMVTLIGVALVTVVTTLSTSIGAQFTSVANTLGGS
jgi:pilus assembly protein Flp/PilA